MDVLVLTIEVCPFGIKLVGVADASCLTHHLVCVDAGATCIELVSGSATAFPRRAALLATENKIDTKSRLDNEMITILCLG